MVMRVIKAVITVTTWTVTNLRLLMLAKSLLEVDDSGGVFLRFLRIIVRGSVTADTSDVISAAMTKIREV